MQVIFLLHRDQADQHPLDHIHMPNVRDSELEIFYQFNDSPMFTHKEIQNFSNIISSWRHGNYTYFDSSVYLYKGTTFP